MAINFNNLPDELVLRIFGLFSPIELQTQIRLVNSKWKCLAEDDSLYREIIANEQFPSQGLGILLRRHCKAIKRLHIIERDDVNDLAQYIRHCSNLESLFIKLCFGGGDNILNAINQCYNLSTISIQHSSCIHNSSELFNILSRRSIKRINLRTIENDLITDDLSRLRRIEDLRLKSINVNTNGIYQFCTNNFETLTTLKLITFDEDFKKYPFEVNDTIFKAIGNCTHLNTLCLGPQMTSRMNDTGIAHLCSLHSLTTLVIYQADLVSISGFANIFRQPLTKNLKKIGLHRCFWVTNAILKIISENCPNLEKFTYEQCKNTKCDEDQSNIVILVKNCKKLKELHLFGMNIGVAYVLHSIPNYLPLLKSLKYSNDDEPMKLPSFMRQLELQMPDFDVCGMQSKYNLYVHCKRKVKTDRQSNELRTPVCSLKLKTLAYST